MNYRLLDTSTYAYTGHFLKNIYILINDRSDHIYGCVPNGTIGISVVTSGDGYIRLKEKWVKQPVLYVYGMVNEVQFHKMSPGYREISIGFKPEYFQLFTRERISGLQKMEATPLAELFSRGETDRLYDALSAAGTDNEIVQQVDAFLQKNLFTERIDKRVLTVLETIRRNPNVSVAALSRLLNTTPVTLRTLFSNHVGVSPKELCRMLRINRALNEKGDEENLTQLAYSLGYYDQSHFIHEFKAAIGLTPGQYFNNNQLTFDFYNYQRFRYESFVALNATILAH